MKQKPHTNLYFSQLKKKKKTLKKKKKLLKEETLKQRSSRGTDIVDLVVQDSSLHYGLNGFVSFRLNNNKLFLMHIFKE